MWKCENVEMWKCENERMEYKGLLSGKWGSVVPFARNVLIAW